VSISNAVTLKSFDLESSFIDGQILLENI